MKTPYPWKWSAFEPVMWLLWLFFISAAVVWVRTATVKASYTYVQSEREYRRLQQEIQALRVEWLRVTTPKQLEKLARELGLSSPKIDQVLRYVPEAKNPPPKP